CMRPCSLPALLAARLAMRCDQSTVSPVLEPHDLPSVVRVILIRRARVLLGLRDGLATTSTGSPTLKKSLLTPCCENCAAPAPSITHRCASPLASSASTY